MVNLLIPSNPVLTHAPVVKKGARVQETVGKMVKFSLHLFDIVGNKRPCGSLGRERCVVSENSGINRERSSASSANLVFSSPPSDGHLREIVSAMMFSIDRLD